jgi:hypothetical protein
MNVRLLPVPALVLFCGGCAAAIEEPAPPTGLIAGTVCTSASGALAEDARVSVRAPDDSEVARAVADAFGGVSVEVPLGSYELVVQIEGEETRRISGVRVVDEGLSVFEDDACIDEGEVGEILGQVCNRIVGDFLREGTVTARDAEGAEYQTEIGNDGAFILTGLPARAYTVVIQAPGFLRTESVEVRAREQVIVGDDGGGDCVAPDPLTTGFITGVICQPEGGESAAGVRVSVTEAPDGGVYESETIDDGSFTIAGIPAPSPPLWVLAEYEERTFLWSGVQVFPTADAPNGTNLSANGCQELFPPD